jgi:hypothetical protein
MIFALIFIASIFNRGRLTFWTCLRMTTASVLSPVLSFTVPVADCDRADVRARTLLRGSLCIAGGLILSRMAFQLERADWLTEIANDVRSPMAVPGSLLRWGVTYADFASRALIAYGILHFIGIPVRLPFNQPWLATNFAEYWRRANVYLSTFLSESLFSDIIPRRGWKKYVAIILVIAIFSGVLHGGGDVQVQAWLFHTRLDPTRATASLHVLERWFAEGLLTGVTLWWLAKRQEARAKAYAKTGKVPAARSKLWQRCAAVGGTFAVLALHGYSMQFHNQGPYRIQQASSPSPGVWTGVVQRWTR